MYVTTHRRLGLGYQATRSWRTGQRLKGESPRDVVSTPPPVTGNLGKDLAARNRYYKNLAANLISQPRYNGHSLSADGGHEFHTITVSTSPGPAFQKWSSGLTIAGQVLPPLWLPEPDLNLIREAERQDPSIKPNRLFPMGVMQGSAQHLAALRQQVSGSITNMLPDAGQMGWFETLIEIARGNFPNLISDLMIRAKRGRLLDPHGAGRDLGSAYLNARFGIEPIARDFKTLIEALMSYQQSLYTSYKRSRKTHLLGVAIPSSGTLISKDSDSAGYTQSFPGSRYTHHIASDVVVKAKFSSLLPTNAANAHWDTALRELRKLGLNEKLTWDLIPWSWLIDWSGFIGSSIENAAAFNLRTGRYASQYMWATRRTTSLVLAPDFESGKGTSFHQKSARCWISARVVHRYPVSPFGLDFTLPSLSAYQWSILIALGFASKR